MRTFFPLRPLLRLCKTPRFGPRYHRAFESTKTWDEALQNQVHKLLSQTNKQKSYKKAAAVGEILIYHVPIPRLIAVTISRVSTIVLFVGCIPFSYASIKDPDRPDWEPIAWIACSIIPLSFVSFTAGPLVKTIYLEIPAYIRGSDTAFRRFLANPPSQARLVLTTQRTLGLSIPSTCAIADLKAASSWFRPINLTYVHPKTGVEGKKFLTREVSGLKKSDPLGIPGVWEVVLNSIKSNNVKPASSQVVEGLRSLRN